MLKLFHSQASPYVRKVMVCAIERNVLESLELLKSAASPVKQDRTIGVHNPTGRVPTGILQDGSAIYGSSAICQYVDTLAGEPKLYPLGATRFRVLTLEALADGLLEACLLQRYELVMRPVELHWPEWIDALAFKIDESLNALENVYIDELLGDFDGGAITVACALGYLDFRFPDKDWRIGHPKISKWFAEVSTRPSMRETMPEG